MAPVDWKEAWNAGVTPWDAGTSPPALHSLLDRELVPAGRILVPGCGTGYDLATLARGDREVVGAPQRVLDGMRLQSEIGPRLVAMGPGRVDDLAVLLEHGLQRLGRTAHVDLREERLQVGLELGFPCSIRIN